MILFHLLIAAVVLLLLGPSVGGNSQAEAATYWVSKSASSASTTCFNSATQPSNLVSQSRLTIAGGLACMVGGDTLIVKAGTYVEAIVHRAIPSGTSWPTATTVKVATGEVVTIQPNAPGGAGGDAVWFYGARYIIFDGFVVNGINVTANSIRINSDGAQISHHLRLQNLDVKNGQYNCIGIERDSDGVEILSSLVHDCGFREPTTPKPHGVYIQGKNHLIDNVSSYHNTNYGFHIYDTTGTAANITVKNSRSYDNLIGGILMASATNIQVYNNIFYGNAVGQTANVPVYLYTGAPSIKFYSNTIYNNNGPCIQVASGAQTATLRNNICYQNVSAITNAGTGTVQSNNLTSGNPQFVNAGAADFHIQSNSPAKDAGFTLGSPYNIDYAGTARPQGASYDIGAYEFLTASAPAAPTSPTATPGNTQVTVGWTASAGATSYTVLRSTTSGGGYSVVQSGISASPYVNTGLTNGTTYYFVIQAVNASGSSPNSAQASATPQPPAPSAPTGLGATAGDAQVTLAWTATAGAVTYNVLRSLTSGSGYSQIISGLTSPSYLNTGLTNTTTYYYVVQAVNGGGTSANSAQASATPTTPPPAIAAPPTNFIATAGDTQVSLSWTASSGADTYTVKRGTADGGPYGTTVISGLATTSTIDTGRTNGTTYYYVVTAVNGGGESGNSTQASATPQIPVAAAPADLTPTAGDTQVSLSWTAAAGATSYSVYKATITGGPYGTAVVTGNTPTSYTVTGLTNGTLYFFVVTAVNAGGESVVSAEVSATPQPAVPAAPTGLGVTASSQQVILTWSAVAGAASYTVSRATTSGGTFTLVATGIPDPTYTDTVVSNGIPYWYVITATNINGTSTASVEIGATARIAAPTHVIGATGTIGRVLTH